MELKTEVLIRTDGGPNIGLGHLTRCTALAHMLKGNFRITFICKEVPDLIVHEIENGGFKVVRIEREEDFFKILEKNIIAVLDGYNFNTIYQQRVKESGCKLVCIDDLHKGNYYADLILNHAPGIEPNMYFAPPYARFALGLQYVLLRPSFLENARKESIENNEISTLLINFGGADPLRLSERALRVALEFKVFKRIVVITGASYKHEQGVSNFQNGDSRIDHRHSLSEKQMLDTMNECDVAILPSSGIVFEVLTTRCKIISGMYAENQRDVYFGLKKEGLFFDAGKFEAEQIRNAISETICNKNVNYKIIDGNSGGRVNKLFKEIEIEQKLFLRKATINDQELTYGWAISKEIRKFSFNQEYISHDNHNNWFSEKMLNTYCFYYIGEIGTIPFGSIRFDINSEEAVISYLVDPTFQGKGLGLAILCKGIERLTIDERFKTMPVKAIWGSVMKSNIPSIKSFERLGFEKIENSDSFTFIRRI